MEQLVVGLETARKLKAAGFDQRTAWAWHQDDPSSENGFRLQAARTEDTPVHDRTGLHDQRGGDAGDAPDGAPPSEGECYAAPTADELAARMSDDGFALLRLPRTPSPRYRANSYMRSSEADTMAEALAGLYLRQHEAAGERSG